MPHPCPCADAQILRAGQPSLTVVTVERHRHPILDWPTLSFAVRVIRVQVSVSRQGLNSAANLSASSFPAAWNKFGWLGGHDGKNVQTEQYEDHSANRIPKDG